MAYTTIPKSSAYFNTKLWSGNSSSQAITGVGFAPDFVWGKQRSGTEGHQVLDIIRGANNILSTNGSGAAAADSQILNSFDSDGYTLGSQNQLNDTGATYASWNWKAGGTGASNTAGSINTTYTSANTTSGMSIIKYTGNGSSGATIGHGMGIKPSMIIIKELNGGNDWIVYTQALTANKILYLNATSAENDNSVFFNDTEPTDSLITLGSISATNGSGAMIAYCFSDVQGYSKQGSYIGNGNANGTFNYTGFKPAFVLTKNSSSGGSNWRIFDNQRLGYNVNNATLYANLSNAEADETSIDLLSNGFKMRTTTNDLNGSGQTYVYMAFAEAPLVSTNGIPATAR